MGNQNKNISVFDVLDVISALNDNFCNLYLKYTIEIMKKANLPEEAFKEINVHNPYQYYLNGHCPSYSRILCEIFKGDAIVYCSSGHVITKIGEHFYDVRGEIDDLVTKEFTIANDDLGLHYIELMFGIKDSVETPIEKELINIGKKVLMERKQNCKCKKLEN